MKVFLPTATSAAALSLLASSASANAPVVRHVSYHAEAANVQFATTDGATGTWVTVDAWDLTFRGEPTQGQPAKLSEGFVHVYRYDLSTGWAILSAGGYVSFAPDAFQMRPNSTTAAFSSTLALWDEMSGEPVSVRLNMEWTATSGPYMAMNSDPPFAHHDGTVRLVERGHVTNREAVATGTLDVGGTTIQLPASYLFAPPGSS